MLQDMSGTCWKPAPRDLYRESNRSVYVECGPAIRRSARHLAGLAATQLGVGRTSPFSPSSTEAMLAVPSWSAGSENPAVVENGPVVEHVAPAAPMFVHAPGPFLGTGPASSWGGPLSDFEAVVPSR